MSPWYNRQPFCFFEESVASKFMETIGISLLGSCLGFLKRHLSVHLGKWTWNYYLLWNLKITQCNGTIFHFFTAHFLGSKSRGFFAGEHCLSGWRCQSSRGGDRWSCARSDSWSEWSLSRWSFRPCWLPSRRLPLKECATQLWIWEGSSWECERIRKKTSISLQKISVPL